MAYIYTTPDRADAYRAAVSDAEVVAVDDLAQFGDSIPATFHFQDGRLVDLGMTDHLALPIQYPPQSVAKKQHQ